MNLKLLISGLLTVAIISLCGVQAKAQSANNDPQSITGTGAAANFNRTLNQQVGSMRFYGKVTMDGGRLPWDPIPIVVKCDGKTRYNTLADKRGEFNIEATPKESELVTSKRDPKHVSPDALVGCKVSAVLDGFQSTSVTIANGSLMDSPDIGTIALHPDAGSAASTVSATTASAPKEAMKEFDKAQGDVINKHPDSARRHLEKAVSIYPQFAEAWYQLGKLEETDKPQDASSAYAKAVAADPKYIQPYERIAALAAVQSKWKEVADAANHSLKLDPVGTPQIWYLSALGNFNVGQKDFAESSALTALNMDPGHVAAPKTEQLLAVILAGRGDYKDALEHLRHCATYTPPGPEADLVKQQVAQVEKLVH